jgi:arylsulfatase A-like enzyme
MRRLSLLLAPALVTTAIAAEPPKPHNVLLFIADGLRAGVISPQDTPATAALLKRGVKFSNTHAVFPTTAIPNAAAIATGHMPGDTGAFGSTIFTGLPDSPTLSLEGDAALGDLDATFAGNALNEDTILRAAAAASISTAIIGRQGRSLIFDHTDRSARQTMIVDDLTGHPGGIPLAPDLQTTLQEFGLANAAPAPSSPAEARKWFAGVALAMLPAFKDRHKPFLMVFWSHDPDGLPPSQGDSLMHLVPGSRGPASLESARQADAELGRLLASLDEQGLTATTDVILASAHGQSTVFKESATSFAATRIYPDLPPAMLPPGFLAIDLARALRMSLFDPDAPADTRATPLPQGRFPTRGNGLIGDDATRPEVVVAANGGSDLIYLLKPDKLTAARIVQMLSAQDYTSGIFVDSRLGSIAGTLPLSAIALEGTALTPTPAIVVNFRSFSIGCADATTCGVEVADTVLPQGQATSGSFSRADTRAVMVAAGPGFRPGYDDAAPVSTADLGRTIAALLGLKTTDKGKQTGRVLTEALVHSTPVLAKSGLLKSASDDSGLVTVLKYQTIGTTRYFDAAGYPGRTLGLD